MPASYSPRSHSPYRKSQVGGYRHGRTSDWLTTVSSTGRAPTAAAWGATAAPAVHRPCGAGARAAGGAGGGGGAAAAPPPAGRGGRGGGGAPRAPRGPPPPPPATPPTQSMTTPRSPGRLP